MDDVVIVGAGPAGSATALLLARAGRSVTLIDQHAFPRGKACGDCISPGANPILARLGVLDTVLSAAPARLRGWRLAAADRAFGAGFDESTYSIAMPRRQFDVILLDAARAAGANVITGARVDDVVRDHTGQVTGVTAVLHGRRKTLAAGLTVGADGLRSRVARRLDAHARLPRLRKLSLTAHLEANVDDRGEMFVRAGMCLGVARVTADGSLCNVTVVVSAGHRPPARARHELLQVLLREFGRSDLARQVSSKTEIFASGPFDWPTRRVLFAGAALVGDAAGYFDPFTGQGVFQALDGAELLAACIMNDDLAAYEPALRTRTRAVRRVQRAVEFVCARPRVARAAFGGLARTPRVAQRLIEVTGDLRPVRDLLMLT